MCRPRLAARTKTQVARPLAIGILPSRENVPWVCPHPPSLDRALPRWYYLYAKILTVFGDGGTVPSFSPMPRRTL